jgi:calcineurin-like phosphoesterase family protein
MGWRILVVYPEPETMSHTIYAAKFEQTIIHQHVHLRRESQSHAQAHVLMRFYPAICAFAVQICYTNTFLLYSY